MAYKVRHSNTKYVDYNTGEVKAEETTQQYKAEQEPPYIKVYLENINYFMDMPCGLDKLLKGIFTMVTYADAVDPMCVDLSKHKKELLKDMIGWSSIQSVENGIQMLVKSKLIYRVARNTYRLNPFFFGKGDWKNISKLRHDVDYSEIHDHNVKSWLNKNKKKEESEFERWLNE